MTTLEQAREAVKTGDTGTLEVLLDAEPALANACSEDNARTLLHTLADYPGHRVNDLETARILIEAGADVNARFPHPKVEFGRETPLHWAASNDDVGLAELLLDSGAEIDADGGVIANSTPAYEAVVFRNVNVANLLVDRGAAVNLMIVAGAGRRDLVDQFFDEAGNVMGSAGALPPWEKPRSPRAALDGAFGFACRNGHLTVAKELLERGADSDQPNPAGETPLDQAKAGAHRKVIVWMAERGIGGASDD